MQTYCTDYKQKKPISLFNPDVNPDAEDPPAYDETGESRYAHLPKVPVPRIIQAPQNIPTLFAFSRTTVYLLFGPESPQQTPKSIVLRGTSTNGPLELEIPIQVLQKPGELIHQLAAKKAIAELEQGRGWLPEAQDATKGELLKTRFESRFSDIVEGEAVRLGLQFEVGGKWCSFVAVEEDDNNTAPATTSKREIKENISYKRTKVDEADLEDSLEFDNFISEEISNFDFDPFLHTANDEDELDENLNSISTAAQRLNQSAQAMGQEIASQNAHINRIVAKSDKVDDQIAMNRARLQRIGDPPSPPTRRPPPRPGSTSRSPARASSPAIRAWQGASSLRSQKPSTAPLAPTSAPTSETCATSWRASGQQPVFGT